MNQRKQLKVLHAAWDRIREELTGNYVRGYALAIHLGIKDFERTTVGNVYYEWGGDFADDGNTGPLVLMGLYCLHR